MDNLHFDPCVFSVCSFMGIVDEGWLGLLVARVATGGMLRGESRSFGDEVQSGKVGGLIYRHKGLLELAQDTHDGFLVGSFCWRVAPVAGAGWVVTRYFFQRSVQAPLSSMLIPLNFSKSVLCLMN